MKDSEKKIVFVIVEGPSDQTSLDLALQAMFDTSKVHVEVTHGDITSAPKVDSSNIVKTVGNHVKQYMNNNHFRCKDMLRIIQIVDTDGAYAPDSYIEENPTADCTEYFTNRIVTPNKSYLETIHRSKRACLKRLIGTKEINHIPYAVYFMSCNLDHVLHDCINSTDQQKRENALQFSQRYDGDPEGFRKFICASDFSVSGDFRLTWDYISKGSESLQRHTNLGLSFPEAENISAFPVRKHGVEPTT